MPDHPVDILLRLAFVEGHVRTHGAWERAVERRVDAPSVDASLAGHLEDRLAAALAASVRCDRLTVGTFLQSIQGARLPGSADLAGRLGLSANMLRMLEHDRISPLRVSAGVWRAFRALWNIPLDVLEGMLRRTHQLVVLRPSYRAALARYRRRSGGSGRSLGIQQAMTELYARAEFAFPPEEERMMRKLLHDIAE